MGGPVPAGGTAQRLCCRYATPAHRPEVQWCWCRGHAVIENDGVAGFRNRGGDRMQPLKPAVSPDASDGRCSAHSHHPRAACHARRRQMAALYAVETRALIQAVKRNKARFPDDFMFRLDADEAARVEITFCDVKCTRAWWTAPPALRLHRAGRRHALLGSSQPACDRSQYRDHAHVCAPSTRTHLEHGTRAAFR